ncbi:Phosphotransferase enzyme family protein [Amycolatopsis marina]|uniref:Phosphotransferase enzyme family protein n=2 Tax=Amycolatopsis marina TaxID=490629 RepID=A0A1I1CRR7_9PSEU|nr:Phosphotransferase enzyme family protein [Amycolatopsis marina]
MLDSGLGRLVGKVGLHGDRAVALRRLDEHRRVWEHGVPVPRLLGFTAASSVVGDRLLIVAEYLTGQDAEDSRSLPSGVMGEAMYSAGAALAGLHGVPVECFGDSDSGLDRGFATWGAAVSSRVELLARAYSERGGSLDWEVEGLVAAGLVLLGRLADEVSVVVRPAVAHLDVYLPNILLDAEGCFRALLDLEHVRWVDPVMDFVKPAMWMFEDQPWWAERFVCGYRSVGGWPQLWSERLAVATGLELLTGVNYWTRVRDLSMREDYVRRLRVWVRSDGVDGVWPATAW